MWSTLMKSGRINTSTAAEDGGQGLTATIGRFEMKLPLNSIKLKLI